MSADRETVALYDARAAEYLARVSSPAPTARLRAFIESLPAGARVLDLGCGPGTAAAAMAAAGLDVDALDAAPGMVDAARARFGLSVRLGTFEDVVPEPGYHGIWANFSLLHAPRSDMANHLARLRAALWPDGLLHLGMKLGTGAARDGLGRFYTYYSEVELSTLLTQAGFEIILRDRGRETGFDGVPADFVILWGRAP